jgi:hypothetical protein
MVDRLDDDEPRDGTGGWNK